MTRASNPINRTMVNNLRFKIHVKILLSLAGHFRTNTPSVPKCADGNPVI
jgi:hypothetical protein